MSRPDRSLAHSVMSQYDVASFGPNSRPARRLLSMTARMKAAVSWVSCCAPRQVGGVL